MTKLKIKIKILRVNTFAELGDHRWCCLSVEVEFPLQNKFDLTRSWDRISYYWNFKFLTSIIFEICNFCASNLSFKNFSWEFLATLCSLISIVSTARNMWIELSRNILLLQFRKKLFISYVNFHLNVKTSSECRTRKNDVLIAKICLLLIYSAKVVIHKSKSHITKRGWFSRFSDLVGHTEMLGEQNKIECVNGEDDDDSNSHSRLKMMKFCYFLRRFLIVYVFGKLKLSMIAGWIWKKLKSMKILPEIDTTRTRKWSIFIWWRFII